MTIHSVHLMIKLSCFRAKASQFITMLAYTETPKVISFGRFF